MENPMRTAITWIVLALPAAAQESLTITRVPAPFGDDPRPFCVSLPEDGRLLAYQSARAGGRGKQDIWLSKFENGWWSEPYNAGPGINTAANDVDAKLSADGNSMVFIRGDDFKVASDIYISYFRNGGWSQAEMMGPPVSLPASVEFGALLSRDGKRLYFSSNRPGGLGSFDHYYSERTGAGWGAPVNLGPGINTPEGDVDIAVSRDGTALVFPSRRSDSIGNSTDLYVSRWVSNAWTAPVNLGPRINTAVTDTCPWLGYDGRTLYLNTEWDGLVAGRQANTTVWEFRFGGSFP